MMSYKVKGHLLHGGGRASKRQTNSFSLSTPFFPPSFLRAPSEVEGRAGIEDCFFSEANPAAGGVSGAKRLGYWWIVVSLVLGYPERPPSGGLVGVNQDLTGLTSLSGLVNKVFIMV